MEIDIWVMLFETRAVPLMEHTHKAILNKILWSEELMKLSEGSLSNIFGIDYPGL